MLTQRRARFSQLLGSVALISGLCLSSMACWAMEVGRPQTLSGLGETLSLKLPLRLSPGETLNADCIKVTVETADQVLAAHQVHKTVNYQAGTHSGWVWVKTSVPIEEPVVKLSLGCPQQQITAFVDPAPALGAKLPAAQAVQSLALPPASKPTKTPAEATAANAAPTVKALARVKVLVFGADGLRFDLAGGAAARAAKPGQDWQQDQQDPARAGFAMLMSLEPGRTPSAAAASAQTSASGAGLSQRVQQAEQEFMSLQKEHASLNQELDSLSQQLAQRQSSSGSVGSPLLLGGAAALLALAGLGYFVLLPRWRLRSVA